MGSESIIGVLALGTIGIGLAFLVYHYRNFLRNPQNRAAAASVANDEKSATSKVAEHAPPGSFHDRPLKARLDDSIAAAHPDDPEVKGSR